MLEDVRLKNVTLFRAFALDNVSNVNLVIGENDTGTSNLLRTLYTVSRFDDEASVGRWSELPVKTLQLTFQPRSCYLTSVERQFRVSHGTGETSSYILSSNSLARQGVPTCPANVQCMSLGLHVLVRSRP